MADGFIIGVYNYCDRWCERCPLTSRCRVFAMEEDFNRGDDWNDAFWNVFDNLPQHEPDECLEDPFTEDSPFEEEPVSTELDGGDDDELGSLPVRHPMVQLAMEYAMQARQWLNQHSPPDEEPAIGPTPAERNAHEVRREDAVDILRWYSHQIGVKLARALHADRDREEEGQFDVVDEVDQEEDEIRSAVVEAAQMDRDGSAKVALIGIERSLGAWTIMRDDFSTHEQTISGVQRTLARLRRFIDQQIPGARIFQRPGFEYDI